MTRADYLESEFAKVLVENAKFCRQRTPEFLLREWDRIRDEARKIESGPHAEVKIIYPSGSTWFGLAEVVAETTDGKIELKLFQSQK